MLTAKQTEDAYLLVNESTVFLSSIAKEERAKIAGRHGWQSIAETWVRR